MNRSRLFSAAAAILTFSTISAVQAQDWYQDRWEVGGQVGGVTVESDSKIDTPHLFGGGRVGYYLTNDVEAEAAILAGSGDVKNNSDDTDMLLPTAELQYHFLDDSSVRPFVAAGLGVLAEDGPSPANTGNVIFPLGGGVKWMVDDNIALRADARWIVDTEGAGETNKLAYTGGISWLFDGPQKETPTPVREERREAQVMPEAAKALERDKHVSINLEVQFDFDKSIIKPQYETRLNEFAAFMKQHPDTIAEIEGHTDSVGTKAYNDRLSMRRAHSVRNYLVSHGGIAMTRLDAKGYGFSRPVASNKTDEGRAENRRVIGTVKVVN